MKKFLIILIGLILIGCTSKSDSNDSSEYSDEQTWVEGRPYYNKGGDTTICNPTPYNYPMDSVSNYHCWSRRWDHQYTAGGQMIDVWYWDDNTCSWYKMPKTGDYYVFRWIYMTKVILND